MVAFEKILLSIILSILIASCAQKDSDELLRKKIVGKWSADYPARYDGDISAYGEGEYKEDGTFDGWNKISFPNGTIEEERYLDNWEIKGRKLILTPAKKYKNRQMNTVIVDTIESIDDKQMILINPAGKKLIRKRVAQ